MTKEAFISPSQSIIDIDIDNSDPDLTPPPSDNILLDNDHSILTPSPQSQPLDEAIDINTPPPPPPPSDIILLDNDHSSLTSSRQNTVQTPSPPPTDKNITKVVGEILDEIKKREVGQSTCTNAWESYTLNEKEYTELFRILGNDKHLSSFVEHKLRYDYFPSKNQFVLRMPTCIHEYLIAKIWKNIDNWLDSIAEGNGRHAKFAQGIEPFNSTTIAFRESRFGKHSPDGQYAHLLSRFPGIVFEVSYSQRRKNLSDLADDYILGSYGGIGAMIGLDIEYRGTKVAVVSVWEPAFRIDENGKSRLHVKQTVKDEVIRDAHGNCTQASLHLELKYFAFDDLLIKLYGSADEAITESLNISAQSICAYLDIAEAKQQILDDADGGLRPKRERFDYIDVREPTPEEIDEETKARRWKKSRQEKVLMRKKRDQMDRDDPSYEPV